MMEDFNFIYFLKFTKKSFSCDLNQLCFMVMLVELKTLLYEPSHSAINHKNPNVFQFLFILHKLLIQVFRFYLFIPISILNLSF